MMETSFVKFTDTFADNIFTYINTRIVACIEIANQGNSAPECSAAKIKKFVC